MRKALAAIVEASLAGSALADPMPGAEIDVESYDLALTPDLQNETVSGRETIRFRALGEGLRQLSFSGAALTIDSATIDGMSIIPTLKGDSLTFNLPRPIARGRTAKLELAYHGHPARGFARSATALYTSYFACDWMICRQNDFGDKAAFSLTLRVPAGMDTISIGRLVSKRSGPDGSEIQRWKAPRPYSAYLYGFAIGRFARVSEPIGPAKLTYLSDVADVADLKRRFALTPDMVRFISDKAGVPLPVSEYRQLLVKGDEAQEAATYSVIGVGELPTKADDPNQDWAIVHELTHQWWGNLVTCASLKDFWLNEESRPS
jgi:aminopeptidase N